MFMSQMRSQSAMEYLMTYGWAILIIAVVLGAIYSLGLFNGAALAPRSQPGSCQVFRPNGPQTLSYISLEGACTNQLPQYVAQFNGQNSYILINKVNVLLSNSILSNNITISAWIYLNHNNSNAQPYVSIFNTGNVICLEQNSRVNNAGTSIAYEENGWGDGFLRVVKVMNWVHVAIFLNSTNVRFYINGALSGTDSVTGLSQISAMSGPNIAIGGLTSCYVGTHYFNGSIANVQVYNTSLDANTIKSLYTEGIGGTPINLQNLVAWWPLNGNANDYSGNQYTSSSFNVVYTNQWLSGYNIP